VLCTLALSFLEVDCTKCQKSIALQEQFRLLTATGQQEALAATWQLAVWLSRASNLNRIAVITIHYARPARFRY